MQAVLNTPAAGVQSSKLSAQPAAKGRTLTCLIEKKVEVKLVGVVSAELSISPVTHSGRN